MVRLSRRHLRGSSRRRSSRLRFWPRLAPLPRLLAPPKPWLLLKLARSRKPKRKCEFSSEQLLKPLADYRRQLSENLARIKATRVELAALGKISPEHQKYCEGLWEQYKFADSGIYIPWRTDDNVLNMPGAQGGSDSGYPCVGVAGYGGGTVGASVSVATSSPLALLASAAMDVGVSSCAGAHALLRAAVAATRTIKRSADRRLRRSR